MKGKNKLVPRLLGITKESVMRVDEKTKDVVQEWPLTTVKRWAASPKSFTLVQFFSLCSLLSFRGGAKAFYMRGNENIRGVYWQKSYTHPDTCLTIQYYHDISRGDCKFLLITILSTITVSHKYLFLKETVNIIVFPQQNIFQYKKKK